ncbi:MAG: alpha/beta hydrolase, partial [Pseudomonadota bacterium]
CSGARTVWKSWICIWRVSSDHMPKSERAGFPTYWTTFGQGPRAALLIHCSLAHSGSWGRMARGLSGLLTMTAFDMPGHGRSGAWDGQGEIQKVTAEIAADFLDGPTDIIGHSFGATVALRLAVMRPDLVRTLTLIEPVFFAVALRDRPESAAAFEAAQGDFIPAMERDDLLTAAHAFTRLWGDGTRWEDIPTPVQQALAHQMHLIAASRAALHDDAGGMLVPGLLDRLDMPVLLVEGSQSPDIIHQINDGLSARLPTTTRTVIMGAGHMAPVTHADQVSAEVLRFLQTS